ncbi:bifunctional lysylphosphatidylglycerol flippase/synthetase MprF [Subtercola frigoramans]|uniref:Lysylphosphatidylglycerol synthetase-like protein (DUF2156 family) n=1 Tax=Subtercola frigoramans TaxID=120298 RepID=A0ABS2L0I1_9MICO|nr:DUF2156 domain-containing protein [Subtercola frigoramans]MBM7470579.1 lysylphosphatidylglycerol synthetase-like protein (DUF2156 family) [Subtercola frigoramans]
MALIAAAALLRAVLFANLAAGTGLDSLFVQHNWIAAGTSVWLVEKPVYLVAVLVATLVLLGVAERLMGPLRALTAFVVVTVLGITIGMAVQGLGVLLDIPSAEATRGQHMTDPLIPVLGTFIASTAYMRPVVARRVRVVGFSLLLVFVLYSGQPSDVYRLTAAVAGLILGQFFTKKRLRLHPWRASFTDARTTLAGVVAVTALGPIVSAMAPARVGLFEPLGALFRDSAATDGASHGTGESAGAILVTILPLALQLIAAFAIFRGQRLGLWLAIGINAALSVMAAIYFGTASSLSAAGNAITGAVDDTLLSVIVAIGVPAAVAVGALGCRRFFPPNTGHIPVHRFFVSALLALVVVSGVYVTVGTLGLSGTAPASFSELMSGLPERLVPEGFLTFEQVQVAPDGIVDRLLYDWLGAAFWSSLVVLALIGIVRTAPEAASSASRKTRAFLKEGLGRGPLAWMTTWSGHHYWYASNDVGIIAYRIISGIAVTTGEPLCRIDDTAQVIDEFVTFCEDHGWAPALYGVSETLRRQFSTTNWYFMKVGEETVLSPETWSLGGKKMQNIRTSLTRAAKTGLTCEWTTYAALTTAQREQISEISDGWVTEKKLPEMGFTLGGVDELKDHEVSLTIATTESGRIEAVTSWLPTFHNGIIIGLTLDFMRRRADGMPGVMDVIVAETMAKAKELGIRTVSLSAAPLAETAAATRKSTALLSRILEPAYGFQSLHRYKSKFQPEVRPLFLMYQDPFALPSIGLGLAKAYVPDISLRQIVGLLKPAR